MVRVALVQLAARPGRQGGAPPAGRAFALHRRDAARHVAQRQRAGRQRLLGDQHARGNPALVDEPRVQVLLQGFEAQPAHAGADGRGGQLAQVRRRRGTIPCDFAQDEAGAFLGKHQRPFAGGRRLGRGQDVGPLRGAGALRLQLLFLAALDFAGTGGGFSGRLLRGRGESKERHQCSRQRHSTETLMPEGFPPDMTGTHLFLIEIKADYVLFDGTAPPELKA